MPRILLTLLVAAGAAFAVVSLTRDDSEKAAQASTPTAAPIIDPKAAPAQIPRRPPVVMIVMDEFPLDIMLGPDGRIDPVRYPNFAALAASGTWFRNAHTVYDSTTKAIPAVLTGKLPRKGGDASYKTHPRTVFDLFGRRGYKIVKSEEATSLCPPRYCRGAKPHRPAILPLLQRGRRERLQRFFAAVKPGGRLLHEARAAAARSVPVPALRQADPQRLPGPHPGDEQPARLRRPLPHPAQPAAPPAPGRLRRPPDRHPDPADGGQRQLRPGADRGDRRPRLRVRGGREGPPDRHPPQHRRDRARADVRQGAGPAPRAHQQRVRAHDRPRAHDRRRAQLQAALSRRRPLGVLARGHAGAGSCG